MSDFNKRGQIVRKGVILCPIHKEKHYQSTSGHYRCSSCNREKRWMRDFEVSSQEIYTLFKLQEFKCAFLSCKREVTYMKKSAYHIDHDHLTGKIRGILCSQHNHALGLMHDNTADIISAAQYLYKHESREYLTSLPLEEALGVIDLV